MGDKYKKNKGNNYKNRGEQFAEAVIKQHDELHTAQNSPATPHNR